MKEILKNNKEKNECFYESIHPYIILRLLAENPKNLDYDVIWNFTELEEYSSIRLENLKDGLEDSDKLLIVTEGKTDTFVIKKH